MFQGGIHLGRLFGIQIRLDWSLIVIFMLVAISLGGGLFPSWHPDWSPVLTWTVAFAAAVLFFASILAHELSHALVAKAFHIPVRSITLFLFGGIANIEQDPDSPKKEALIAGAGPLTSLVIGVVFTVLGSMLAGASAAAADDPMQAAQQMGPVATLLAWLGPVNVLLALFNLVPGFPLDGGRLFRALIWAITHDLHRATRWATRGGQTFAFLLILSGVAMAFGATVPFFGSGLGQGIWLVFIGWFLNAAATMSYRQLVVRQALQGVPVHRIMRHPTAAAIPPTASVEQLVDDYIMPLGEQTFLVGAGSIEGVVHADDVKKIPRSSWAQTAVGQITHRLSELPSVSSDQDASVALRELTRRGVNEVIVLEGQQVVGLVRQQDVLRWLELQSREDRSGKSTMHPVTHPR